MNMKHGLGARFIIIGIAIAVLGARFIMSPPIPTPPALTEKTQDESTTETTTNASWWKPEVGINWQIQFTEPPINAISQAKLYDLDLYDIDANFIGQLNNAGSKAICYINMGAWEDWRSDKNNFPQKVLGKDYEGWPGERWLDIRDINSLAPIVGARLDLCKSKGFAGVEPDNMNGYQNDTGFPLTANDQIKFNKFVASEAHKRGLAIGLKNDTEQARELVNDFDWIVTEGCADEGWCGEAEIFLNKNKPVLQIEYTDTGINFQQVCQNYVATGFSPILKNRNLDGWIELCNE